jgi:hypothetical protein
VKNDVNLAVRMIPGELTADIAPSVDCCNLERYHEALPNVTPADVWFGGREEISARRRPLQVRTMIARGVRAAVAEQGPGVPQLGTELGCDGEVVVLTFQARGSSS